MSIQGSLKTFSFPELLSALQQFKKCGVLRLVSEMQERGLLIQGGNIIYATTQDPSRRMGSFLVRLGILSDEELQSAAAWDEGTEVYFGERLVDAGKVTRDELRQAVKWQVLDVVEEVISWDEGAFYFDESELPFALPLGKPISTHSILLEATRRVDEKRLVQDLFPNPDVVLQHARTITAPPGRAEIRDLLESVDGHHSVDAILLKAGHNTRQAVEVLRALVDQGALSIVPGSGTKKDAAQDLTPRCFPVSPDIPGRVFASFNQNSCQLEAIEDVVQDDPLLAAKILREVARRQPELLRGSLSVSSILNGLGTHELRGILIPEAIRGVFFPRAQWHWKDWWTHSRAVARTAKSIAVTIGYPAPDEAYLAGLLHNLGAFVFMSADPQKYQSVALDSSQKQKSLLDVEDGVYGITHPALGAEWAKRWDFPEQLVAVIRQHHQVDSNSNTPLVNIVVAADGIARGSGFQVECLPSWDSHYESALTKLGLPRRKANSLLSHPARAMTKNPVRTTNFSY